MRRILIWIAVVAVIVAVDMQMPMAAAGRTQEPCVPTVSSRVMPGDTLQVAYRLHGQTRRFKFVYEPTADGGLSLHWSIVRNLKLWTGSYAMSAGSVKDGTAQSWLMPEDGSHIALPVNETYGIISHTALASLKKKGEFVYNGVLWRKTGESTTSFGKAIEVEDPEEGARMTILDNLKLPLIVSMQDNPLEIDWNFY